MHSDFSQFRSCAPRVRDQDADQLLPCALLLQQPSWLQRLLDWGRSRLRLRQRS